MRLAWEVRDYGRLPIDGGLWDQPAGLVARMRAVERVYNTITGYNRAASRKRWDEANPGALKFKLEIDKLREAEGDA